MDSITANADRLRDIRVQVRTSFLELGSRDEDIVDAFAFIEGNVEDFKAGAASPRRGLFVVGESGTGKTFSINHHLRTYPAFQPKLDEYNRKTQPVVSVTVPKKASTMDILVAILTEMDVPAEGNERDLTRVMHEQFKERQTVGLHLDELQHAIRSNTPKTIEAIQDWIKSLLQVKDWPLHVIVSGMPRIKSLLRTIEVGRRTKVITFRTLECPEDEKMVEFCVRQVAEKGCGLSLASTVQTPEFFARLCHAAAGGPGTIIEITQEACFRALRRQRSEVTLTHFSNEYLENTGCRTRDNIFTSTDWKELSAKYRTASTDDEE
jgi:AAA domain